MPRELNGSSRSSSSSDDVAARAERHGVQVIAPVGVEQRLVGRQDGGRAGAQVGEQLGLRRRNRLQGAEQLEVDGPDVDDDADVGLGDRRQLGDLAGAAHRHLEHEHLGAGGGREDRQRQADLRVEVLRAGDHADVRGQHRREDVLRRRLAGRAGDRDDLGAERAAPGARQGLQPGERVLGLEDHARLREAVVVGVVGRDEHAPRAGVERLRGEAPAVDVAAGQADEQIARCDGARVDRHACGPGRTVGVGIPGRGDELHAGGLGEQLRRPVAHAAPLVRRRRRRTGACARPRTPGPARGPCRR